MREDGRERAWVSTLHDCGLESAVASGESHTRERVTNRTPRFEIVVNRALAGVERVCRVGR